MPAIFPNTKSHVKQQWSVAVRRRLLFTAISAVVVFVSAALHLYTTMIVNIVAPLLVCLAMLAMMDRQRAVEDKEEDDGDEMQVVTRMKSSLPTLRADTLFTNFGPCLFYGVVCLMIPPIVDCVPLTATPVFIFAQLLVGVCCFVPLYTIALSFFALKESRAVGLGCRIFFVAFLCAAWVLPISLAFSVIRVPWEIDGDQMTWIGDNESSAYLARFPLPVNCLDPRFMWTPTSAEDYFVIREGDELWVKPRFDLPSFNLSLCVQCLTRLSFVTDEISIVVNFGTNTASFHGNRSSVPGDMHDDIVQDARVRDWGAIALLVMFACAMSMWIFVLVQIRPSG